MGTDLIWVDEKQAEEYKKLHSDEEKYRWFEEYLAGLKEETKKEFKANLESLEEDVAIYTGLMLKVKQSFEKAKNEQLSLSYSIWENFEKEMPSIKDNVDKIIDVLKPLEIKLKAINELLGNINTWNIEKVSKTITSFTELYGKNKEMFLFLIENFNDEPKRNTKG